MFGEAPEKRGQRPSRSQPILNPQANPEADDNDPGVDVQNHLHFSSPVVRAAVIWR